MRIKQLFILISVWSLLGNNPAEASYAYKLSVAAIFRDEAPYLKEWIEYYKLMGVEHFYLYNNLSQDNYKEVLAPYIAKKDVTLVEWSQMPNSWGEWDQIQLGAYKDALKLAKKKTKWLAFIDIDEFIVPIAHKDLITFLVEYPSLGGVCIPWVFFGTSHVEKIPADRLLVETLLLNGGPVANGNLGAIWQQGSYKSIVRTRCVDEVVSPHYCTYKKGCAHAMVGFKEAQINHYWTRDESYLRSSKIPRRLAWGQDPESTLAWAQGMNNDTESCKPILKFVPALRARMGLK